MDLVNCPFLNVKKLGIIHVYSKSSGILCPGTYAGQMLALPPQADRIAIYSRDDDETIAEKVIRGIVASYIFDLSSTFQVHVSTLTEGATDIEQALLNKDVIFPHVKVSVCQNAYLSITTKNKRRQILLNWYIKNQQIYSLNALLAMRATSFVQMEQIHGN